MAPTSPRPHPEPTASPRTNLAMRQKYKNSKRRTSWTPLLFVVGGVASIVAVVQFARREPDRPVTGSHADASTSSVDRGDRNSSPPIVTGETLSPEPAVVPNPGTASSDRDTASAGKPPNDDIKIPPSTPAPRPAMSSRQRRQFGALLRDGRKEIGGKRFHDARTRFTKAASFPANDDDLAKLERLRLLCDYVEEFWNAFAESLSDLEGVELAVEGKQALVVSVDPAEIILRELGENRRYSTTNLPPALILAIADRRFDHKAASSSVFRGAFMAVEPAFGKDRARQLWRSASEAGVDIGDLELVLDDTYD